MLTDDVCDGCPTCADLCEDCWERGRERPVSNHWYVRVFGATPRCEDCEQDASEAAYERQLESFYGGGWVSERERMDEARRLK